jgi:hypothetical protein
MPGIFMPRIPAECSRRILMPCIPMRRTRHHKPPGVSKSCLSASEPLPHRYLPAEWTSNLQTFKRANVQALQRSTSNFPFRIISNQKSKIANHRSAHLFLKQLTTQTPTTSNHPQKPPPNETKTMGFDLFLQKKDSNIFYSKIPSSTLPIFQPCKRIKACSSNVPTPILIRNHKSQLANPKSLPLFLEKEIQKNKPKSNPRPLHIRPRLQHAPHIRFSGVTQPELNDICIELFRNN